MSTTEQQQGAPQEMRNVVNFLRSSKAGLKIRVGVLNGKRVDYFKGGSPLAMLPRVHLCDAAFMAARQVRREGIVVAGVCQDQEYPQNHVGIRSTDTSS
jgi:hypothetical protein